MCIRLGTCTNSRSGARGAGLRARRRDARFGTPIYILYPLHFRISACWIVYGTGLEFFSRNFRSVLHAVWHACVTLHLTPISDVPDRVLRWALILRVACVGNRFARVLVPCAAQQGDPTSAGVNQGELRRRFTACGRHDSGPPHCPTVFPPHRRKPGPVALCDP